MSLTRATTLILAGALLSMPGFPAGAQPVDTAPVRPFTIQVPEPVLADLRERLARSRLPEPLQGAGWTHGTDLGYLERLLAYWRDGFDWRAAEGRLNQMEQFTTVVDGLTLHFVHRRSPHAGALPLLVTHGWPGSIAEFTKIIGPLTDPAADGGRAEDAFHVVMPSIPGFGFSEKPREPGFDPEAVFATIQRERINFTLLVPTMIYVLLDHPALAKHDLSSLELLLYGASAMSPSRLVEGIERIGPVFSQLYGQTECYPVSVLRKADHDPRTPELFLSCGFPIAACEVKILDDNDREVAQGEAGEICVRAPHVMAEYWKRPETTAETLKSGWLHTGDIARRDERGYMFILDRKKDMIVSGGFNIFPREVEDVLTQHADVAMCAVVGVPDDKWGEAVTAVVVAREGSRPNAEELIALVKAKKGAAHAPKQIQFVKELPMTGVGKVDKKVLKASFWAGRERMVG